MNEKDRKKIEKYHKSLTDDLNPEIREAIT
jgi:hypothetical protein